MYESKFNHVILNKYINELEPSFLDCINIMKKNYRYNIDFQSILNKYKFIDDILRNHKNKEEIYFAFLYEYVLLNKYTFRINLIEPLKQSIEHNKFNEILYFRKLCRSNGEPTIAGKNYYALKYGSIERRKVDKGLVKVLTKYVKPKKIENTENESILYLSEKGFLDIFTYKAERYGIITINGQMLIKGNKRSKENLFVYPIEEYFLELN